MPDKLMDTEPGGESTQYESIKTVTVPASKSGGDLGQSETAVANKGNKTDEEVQERGEQTADNIGYGQNISESGMGGMTTGMGGSADTPVEAGDSAEHTRKEQGYGGENDMDETIGA